MSKVPLYPPPLRDAAAAGADPAILEQLLRRKVKWFRGGLVFKAHRIVYHSALGSRVMTKKKPRV